MRVIADVSLHKVMSVHERPVESRVTPEVMSRIRGAEELISVYGSWPDFHDSEIIVVALDRGNHMEIVEAGNWAERVGPSLTAKVMTFDYRVGDPANRKYRLVTLRFNGLNEFFMESFSYQNPVMGIGLRAEPEGTNDCRLSVEWGGTVMAHEARFTCESIDVLSVEPFDPQGSVKANRPMRPTAGSGG